MVNWKVRVFLKSKIIIWIISNSKVQISDNGTIQSSSNMLSEVEMEQEQNPEIASINGTFFDGRPLFNYETLSRVLTPEEFSDEIFVWAWVRLNERKPDVVALAQRHDMFHLMFYDLFLQLRNEDLICPGPFQDWLSAEFKENHCVERPPGSGWLRVSSKQLPMQRPGKDVDFRKKLRLLSIAQYN